MTFRKLVNGLIYTLVSRRFNKCEQTLTAHSSLHLACTFCMPSLLPDISLMQVASHFRQYFSWLSLVSSRDRPAFFFPVGQVQWTFFSSSQAKCRFCQVRFSQVNLEDGFRLKIVIILNVSNIKIQFHMWHLN